MSISFSRVVARVAVVCAFAATSLGTVFVSRAAASTVEAASSSASTTNVRAAHAVKSDKIVLGSETRSFHSSAPVKLHSSSNEILAFAPSKAAMEREGGPLTVVYLHGMHGRAENGCPWLRPGANEIGWLVCPEAILREDGGWSWGGDVVKQGAVVSNAIKAAQAEGASTAPGVAVGFSQGSYVALDLVKTRLGQFRGLVLLAAPEAHPSANKLHDAGIKRVALGAGSLDGSHDALVADAKRLQNEGMDARFFDLGAVGHTYAAENTDALREAIAWAGGATE